MSEFWKRKLRTYFCTFDLDKDGVISKADWLGIGLGLAESLKADKQQMEQLKIHFENVFEQFMRKSDTSDKNALTIKVLTESVGKQLYNPDLMRHYTDLMQIVFDLLDLNHDGYLDEDEYQRFLAQIGVQDASFAREVSRAMAVSGDGKLSFDAYANAFWDFFFSDDEKSPNAFYFGPLVD